jgi:hypothetical protein
LNSISKIKIKKNLNPIARNVLHRKKKVSDFPVPSRDVTTKLSLAGNNYIIPRRGEFSVISDIPAGDGKIANLFVQ